MFPFGELVGEAPITASPTPWPPAEWVELTAPGVGLRLMMHRSGVRLLKLSDGTVNVDRGDCSESKQVAGIIEEFLWGTGYTLLAGGGPGDPIAVYRAP